MGDSPLDQDVQNLAGVGPQRAALLQRLGVQTVRDLLWMLPRDVLDLTQVRQPADLVAKELQTVRGTVVDVEGREISGGRSLSAALLDCGTDFVRCVWFNQPWMLKRVQPGQVLLCSGKPKKAQGRWEFSSPRLQWLSEEDGDATGGLLPRYGLTEGLKMAEMQRIVRHAVEQFADAIPDAMPETFRKRRKLPHLAHSDVAPPGLSRGI